MSFGTLHRTKLVSFKQHLSGTESCQALGAAPRSGSRADVTTKNLALRI